MRRDVILRGLRGLVQDAIITLRACGDARPVDVMIRELLTEACGPDLDADRLIRTLLDDGDGDV